MHAHANSANERVRNCDDVSRLCHAMSLLPRDTCVVSGWSRDTCERWRVRSRVLMTRHTLLKYSALHNKLHQWCFQESLAATVRRARPPSGAADCLTSTQSVNFQKAIDMNLCVLPALPRLTTIHMKYDTNKLQLNHFYMCGAASSGCIDIIAIQQCNAPTLAAHTTASTAMACVRCVLASAVRLDSGYNVELLQHENVNHVSPWKNVDLGCLSCNKYAAFVGLYLVLQ